MKSANFAETLWKIAKMSTFLYFSENEHPRRPEGEKYYNPYVYQYVSGHPEW